MSDEKWGIGDIAKAQSWGFVKMGDADSKQAPVELLYGEHPHSRSDNNVYARFPDGHITGFDGHRILIDVSIRSSNYLKDSHLSGDEIRKGGRCVLYADGVAIYEFFFRDPQWALRRADQLISELSEHPSWWLVKSERERLIGKKIYYDRDPARIVSLIEDQGCLIIEPDGVAAFAKPIWSDPNGIDEGERDSLKVEVTDKKIWWYRNG